MDYYEAMESYSRIELLRSYENLQSYCTTTKLWKLTLVLHYYEAMEKLTLVLHYYEAMESYSRIELLRSYGSLHIVIM